MPAKGNAVTIQYFAWNSLTGGYQSGDVSNHNVRIIKDGNVIVPSNDPLEITDVNAPGVYKLTLSDSENNGSFMSVVGVSSTDHVSILPVNWSNEHYLAPNGLDGLSIDAPNGAAENFKEALVLLYRRFFSKVSLSNSHLRTYADDGTTIVTSQGVSDDGVNQTVDSA